MFFVLFNPYFLPFYTTIAFKSYMHNNIVCFADLSSFSPTSGWCPVIPTRLMWSLINTMSPLLKAVLRPPAALVTISVLTPSNFITLTGIVTWMGKRADIHHFPYKGIVQEEWLRLPSMGCGLHRSGTSPSCTQLAHQTGSQTPAHQRVP